MSILGGITRPVTNVAQKAAKAGQIKSIKLKIKMRPGEDKGGPGAKTNAKD
jgi:hypothetical protein